MRTIALLLAASCAACSPPSPNHRDYSDTSLKAELVKLRPADAAHEASAAAADAAAAAGAAASDAAAAAADAPRVTAQPMTEPGQPPRVGAAAPATAAPMLAYSYAYGVEAPAAQVRPLMTAHERTCVQAGRAACQVVGSSIGGRGRDHVSAMLQLRASPVWIARFRAGLPGQAGKAGGRITQDTTESEDLTRQITDTEATLRAKTTLRDRLQNLLATRPGKLSDLLDVERELARVQAEIDSMTSELAVMRARVATSALTVQYESEGVLAPAGVAAPLKQAVDDFLGIVFFTLAGMVRLVAWLLPWVLIGGILAWLFRGRLGRLRWAYKGKPKAKPAPPPE